MAEGLKYVTESNASRNRFVVNWGSIIDKYDKEFPEADVLDLDNFSIVHDRGELKSDGFSCKPFGSCRLPADKKRHTGHDTSSEGEDYVYDDLALSIYAESVLSCTLDSPWSQGRNQQLSSPEDIERELKVHSMITAADPSDGETISSLDSDESGDEYDGISSDDLEECTDSQTSATSGQPSSDQSNCIRSIKQNTARPTETDRADCNTAVKKTLNFSTGISPISLSESDSGDDDQFLSLGESPVSKSVQNRTPGDRGKVRLTLNHCSPLRQERRHVSAKARITGVVPPRRNNAEENCTEEPFSDISQSGVPENARVSEGFSRSVPDRSVSGPVPVTPRAEPSRPLISVIQDLAGPSTRGNRGQNEERVIPSRSNFTSRNNNRYDEVDSRVTHNPLPERAINSYQSVPPNLILSVASSNDAPFSASNMQLFQLVPIGGQQSLGPSSVDQRRTDSSGPNSSFDHGRSNHRELLPNHNLAQSSTSCQFQRRNDASRDGQDFAPRSPAGNSPPVPIDLSRTPARDRRDSAGNSAQPSQSDRQGSNDLLVGVDMRTDQTSKEGLGNKILDQDCGELPGRSGNDRLDLQSPSSSRSFPIPRSDKQEMTNIKIKECLEVMSRSASPKQHGGQPEQVSSPQCLENSISRFNVASESTAKKGETFQSPSWKIPARPQTPKSSSFTPTRYSTQELMNIFQSPLPFRHGSSPLVNIRPSPKQRSVKKELSTVFQSEPPKLIHTASPLLDRREIKAAVRDPWKTCEKKLNSRPSKVTAGDQYNQNPDSSKVDRKQLEVIQRSSVVDPDKRAANFGTSLKNQSRILTDTFDDIDGVKSSPQHGKVLGASAIARSPLKKDSVGLGRASAVDYQKDPCEIKSPRRKHSPCSNAKPRRIELTTQKLQNQNYKKPSDETYGLGTPVLHSTEVRDTPNAVRHDPELARGSPCREKPLENVTKQDPFRSPLQGKRLVRLQKKRDPDKIIRKHTLHERPSQRNRKIQDDLQSLVRLGTTLTHPGVPEADASDTAVKSPLDDNSPRKDAGDRKLGPGDASLSGKAIVAKFGPEDPLLSGKAILPKELGPDYQCFHPNLCSTVIGDAGLPGSGSQSDVEDEQTQSEISSLEKVEKWLSGLESPEEVIVECDGEIRPEIVDNEIEDADEFVSLTDAGQVGQNLRDSVSSKSGRVGQNLRDSVSRKTGVSRFFTRKTFADIVTGLMVQAEKENEESRAGDASSDIVSLSSESSIPSRKVSQNRGGQAVADASNAPSYHPPVKLEPVSRNSPKNPVTVKQDWALPKYTTDRVKDHHVLKKCTDEMSPKLYSKTKELHLKATPRSCPSVERGQTAEDSVSSVDKNNNTVQGKRLIISKTSSGTIDCNVLGEFRSENGSQLTAPAGSVSRHEKLKVSVTHLDAGRRLNSARHERKVQESKLPRMEPQMLCGKDVSERVRDLQSVRVPNEFRAMNAKGDGSDDFTKLGREKQSRKRKFQYNSESDSDKRTKLSKVEKMSRKSSLTQSVVLDCEQPSGRKKLSHNSGILRKSTQMPLSDSSDSRMLIVDRKKKSVMKGNTGGKLPAVPRKEVTFMESVDSFDDPDEGGLCDSFTSPCAERCLGQGRCNKSFCFDCV